MTQGTHVPMDRAHLGRFARNTAGDLAWEGRVRGRRVCRELRDAQHRVMERRALLERRWSGQPGAPAGKRGKPECFWMALTSWTAPSCSF